MLLDKKPSDALVEFITAVSDNVRKLDVDDYVTQAKYLIEYYKKQRTENPLDKLMVRWYENEPDYSVYAVDEYLIELWACWSLYSRLYLRNIRSKLYDELSKCDSFLDLGNGFGYSTVVLKELFPHARVVGTNFKQSEQWLFCEYLQKTYDFELKEDCSEKEHMDVVFASEYFEHIYEPIEHLREVVENKSPNYMIIANSFNTVGIGHFTKYMDLGIELDQKEMSRRFNSACLDLGYEKHPTVKFFNGTPTVWVKSNHSSLEEFL